jgi:hypothetical protein
MGKRWFQPRNQDEHLPYPQHFHRSLDPHKRLDRFFIKHDGLSALDVLKKLNDEFGLGGAVPYITIRPEKEDRSAVIVIRNSEDGDEVTTGVSASGLTETQAQLHPTARTELEKHATRKLLRLQAQNSPTTVRYSQILLWWLESVRPEPTTPERDERRRRRNRDCNVRDPDDVFVEHLPYVTKVVEFFQERRLSTHTDGVGDDFAKWHRRALIAAGAPIVGKHPKDGQDGTIAEYHRRLAAARNAFAKEFRPPIRLGFKRTYGKTDHQQKLATGLRWPEVLRVLAFRLGYVWNEDGFARHWVERNGLRRREWIKLEKHRTFYFPVFRLIILYFLTGTRLARIISLGWEPEDYRGWIDLGRNMIIRNGRKAPHYPRKPRRPSRVLPAALRVFSYWFARDRRQREREQWDDVGKGGFYVAHDGRGGKVANLAYRAKLAFKAVGIDHTPHDLKSAGVGVFWEAGFDLRRTARITGNDPQTLEENYLFLIAESEGVLGNKTKWAIGEASHGSMCSSRSSQVVYASPLPILQEHATNMRDRAQRGSAVGRLTRVSFPTAQVFPTFIDDSFDQLLPSCASMLP